MDFREKSSKERNDCLYLKTLWSLTFASYLPTGIIIVRLTTQALEDKDSYYRAWQGATEKQTFNKFSLIKRREMEKNKETM